VLRPGLYSHFTFLGPALCLAGGVEPAEYPDKRPDCSEQPPRARKKAFSNRRTKSNVVELEVHEPTPPRSYYKAFFHYTRFDKTDFELDDDHVDEFLLI
jgi:hypothetical protein